MKEFQTRIAIRAPVAKIWSLLTDAAAYPAWNTTVRRVDGTIAHGQKVTVHPQLATGRAFPVKVAELAPGARMVWRGGVPFLFAGERTFTLEPQADGVVEFRMREAFTGLMAPLLTRSIPDLQPAFDEFAACLKKQAEA